MDVTVAGEIDEATGFVMDLTELKELIQENIIKRWTIKPCIDVEFMKNVLPSTENIARKFWEQESK
jgi:6-pyruvoyltetrahydropterin/6-carboxytetrahydropterin synthase